MARCDTDRRERFHDNVIVGNCEVPTAEELWSWDQETARGLTEALGRAD